MINICRIKKDGLGDRRPAKEHFNLWRKTIELDRLVDFRQDTDHVTSNCKKRGRGGVSGQDIYAFKVRKCKKKLSQK